MKKEWFKWSAVIVVIIAVGGYWSWHQSARKKVVPSLSTSVVVKVAKVTSGEAPIELQSIGQLLAREQVTLSAQVAGTIHKIGFKEGQEVKQGMPLIWLDSRIYEAQLKAAKAKLYIDALTYERDQKVAKFLAKETLDQVKATYQNQQANVDRANTELSETTIVAPFLGRLGVRHINLGQYVNVGDELVTLVDDDHLRVDYWVPDRYLSMLKVGQKISLKVAGKQQEFIGKVIFISPMVDSNTGSVEVQAKIVNPSHQLFPGQYVKVTQFLGMTHGLMIPARSLLPTMTGEQVYTVNNNIVSSQSVVVRERKGDFAVISKGLSLGDLVVTDGQQKLRDGMKVIVAH